MEVLRGFTNKGVVDKMLLKLTNIKKSFNNNPVLKGIDLELMSGTIHALLGENGAGKSTLCNIIGGVLKPDEGEIFIEGKRVHINSPVDAVKQGISYIHQDFMLIDELSVMENIFLGRLFKKGIFIDKQKLYEETRKILTDIGLDLTGREKIANLSIAQRQMIEIAKALSINSKIILMDEPTSALTDVEIEKLFNIMKKLKQKGLLIIYISHKLNEVFSICDTYTVLREGRIVKNGNINSTTPEEIARLMVGQEVKEMFTVSKRNISDEIVLDVKEMSVARYNTKISFYLKKGEILGFTGLMGDGRDEIFETLYGMYKGKRKEVYINGIKKSLNSPKDSLSNGVAYLPRDRKENALFPLMSVKANITISALKSYSKFGIIKRSKENRNVREIINKLKIKAFSPDVEVKTLSGGNQQKAMIARLLETNSNILIFNNPTQGVDILTKKEIYTLISDLSNQGKSIIVLSGELPEILGLCDRFYILYKGEIVGEFKKNQITQDEAMEYMVGLKKIAMN